MSSQEIGGRPGAALSKAAGRSQITNYRLAKQSRQLTEEIQASTEIAAVRDSARAFVTARAMTNATTLAMQMEAHVEMAPHVASHLDMLMRSYTVGAAQQISQL